MIDPIGDTLVARDELKAKIAELGERISADYEGKDLVVIGLLNGVYPFFADLTRAVMSAITSATIKAVASAATDLGKGVENLGKDAGKAADTEVNKIKKGIGGLFGK